MFLDHVTVYDWLRLFLLFAHLVFCAFAITAVLKADLAVVRGNFNRENLRVSAKYITFILLALWITGLAIIYIDTGFNPDVLLSNPKLLLKLLCVVTLTINGVVLHYISFPILIKATNKITVPESFLLAISGGISTSHWMLAAFIGMSKPLGRLPLEALLLGYGFVVLVVIVGSLLAVPLVLRIKRPSDAGTWDLVQKNQN